LRIRDAWAHGLSDDLLLTQAVRAAGLQIHFVAACLVPTVEPCSWRQLLEWTNRQVAIGRVYIPHSWGASVVIHFLSLTWGGLAMFAIAKGEWLASGLLLSYWLIHGLSSVTVCRAALQRLAAHGLPMAQRAWVQALWGPAVTALALVNIAVSLMSRTITWRGISYTMLSSQHIIVHRQPSITATVLTGVVGRDRS
jgi:hypothetical protein